MLDVVSATRLSEREFWQRSALGQSLVRLGFDDEISTRISYENSRSLSSIYNEAIAAPDAAELIVFVHDDVWIDDIFFSQQIQAGLETFDVIGVAGSKRRLAGQPSWAFINTAFDREADEHLSGRVAHGPTPFGSVSCYGHVPAQCQLLDGLLLAARSSTLQRSGVTFDDRFQFHFYDLDFCRTATRLNLRLGTWPITVTHQSGGSFGSEQWQMAYAEYLAKWSE